MFTKAEKIVISTCAELLHRQAKEYYDLSKRDDTLSFAALEKYYYLNKIVGELRIISEGNL